MKPIKMWTVVSGKERIGGVYNTKKEARRDAMEWRIFVNGYPNAKAIPVLVSEIREGKE